MPYRLPQARVEQDLGVVVGVDVDEARAIHFPAASITSGQPVASSGPAETVATTPSRMPNVRIWGLAPVPSNHRPSRTITS